MLAVVHRDPNVLHRKARDRALAQHLPHALLDCRNELSRNRATHHFVDELEPAPPLQRLDAQIDLAELARAARLFLVTAVTLGGTRDGLAIRNARRMRLHVYAVALRHALQHHAQMELA